ncbi:phosphate ABC transporter substrate-binding protein, partial [Candidatus Bathyarchaeota archaeon]|nr:phosphate ABC transporter substrate-binding protein [Candidatus Bathyarchaeota archaeon]
GVGYFAAGPLTYNRQIADLKTQLEHGGGAIELSGSISVAGSTTVLPISQECANLFMAEHNKVQISVAGGGSGHGVKAAGSGEVNIGEASRNIKESELLSYPDLVAFSVAKDSVAVVINPDNPLAGSLDLTLDEVSEIFSGETTNWSELGGPDHEIEVYTREEGSGTREVFSDYAMMGKEFVASAGVKPSNGEMRAAVAGNEYGIAYVSFGYIDGSLSAAMIEGVEASVENVNNGEYPITRILWMFTKGMPSTLEAAFIEFIQGPEGQAVVEDMGYIPIY